MSERTKTDHIRRNIERRLGLDRRVPDLDALKRSEWSSVFERYMRNRLVIGAMRYTLLNDPDAPKWDTIGSIIDRAQCYLQTGNQEHLVDIANLAMIEFCRPSCHSAPHWSPADDGQHTKKKP
jgi:hypothetical protein